MIDLTQHQELIVRQHVENFEVFTGFETKNRYAVLTPEGDQVLYAFEESGGLARYLLKRRRPLDIHVIDPDQNTVLSANRKFYLMFSHLNVNDASGNHVGTLNRKFGIVKRRFTLTDARDQLIGEIRGSAFRQYTFSIHDSRGEEIGLITKQWSGIMRELFTDADTFQVQFSELSMSPESRLLVLASAFAIDLDFFER